VAQQFQAGDLVKRIRGSFREVEEGEICEVVRQEGTFLTLQGKDGTYDTEKFELVPTITTLAQTAAPREFQIGDRVRMINENPRHGRGEVRVGDIGVIVAIGDGLIEYRVDFDRQKHWGANGKDIEHEHPQVVTTVAQEVSLDEAVANWQAVSQQIKELQVQAAAYERIMRINGLKPV
jgi:hypothetical protein